jgi:hypothetical protein
MTDKQAIQDVLSQYARALRLPGRLSALHTNSK